MKISVILPTLNEERHQYLSQIIDCLQLQRDDNWELIVVDSGSTDHTLEFLKPHADKIICIEGGNRALRMNKGAEVASGDILLFHHAVTLLPAGAFKAIRKTLSTHKYIGGGFKHQFDKKGVWYRLNSLLSDWRAYLGIIYIDQIPFVKKEAFFDVGGFPNIDVFEDWDFPRKLMKIGKTKILPLTVITSARRYEQNGKYYQSFLNQFLKLLYLCGVSPRKLNAFYEGLKPFNVPDNEYEQMSGVKQKSVLSRFIATIPTKETSQDETTNKKH